MSESKKPEDLNKPKPPVRSTKGRTTSIRQAENALNKHLKKTGMFMNPRASSFGVVKYGGLESLRPKSNLLEGLDNGRKKRDALLRNLVKVGGKNYLSEFNGGYPGKWKGVKAFGNKLQNKPGLGKNGPYPSELAASTAYLDQPKIKKRVAQSMNSKGRRYDGSQIKQRTISPGRKPAIKFKSGTGGGGLNLMDVNK